MCTHGVCVTLYDVCVTVTPSPLRVTVTPSPLRVTVADHAPQQKARADNQCPLKSSGVNTRLGRTLVLEASASLACLLAEREIPTKTPHPAAIQRVPRATQLTVALTTAGVCVLWVPDWQCKSMAVSNRWDCWYT